MLLFSKTIHRTSVSRNITNVLSFECNILYKNKKKQLLLKTTSSNKACKMSIVSYEIDTVLNFSAKRI